jgi:hypothetical protein
MAGEQRGVRSDAAEARGANQLHGQPCGPEPAHEEVGLLGAHTLDQAWIGGRGSNEHTRGAELPLRAAQAEAVPAADGGEHHVMAIAGEEQGREREAEEHDPEAGHARNPTHDERDEPPQRRPGRQDGAVEKFSE